jgi:hypothetical protein
VLSERPITQPVISRVLQRPISYQMIVNNRQLGTFSGRFSYVPGWSQVGVNSNQRTDHPNVSHVGFACKCAIFSSAPGRIRTCDRRIRSPLLCPLSYGRIRLINRKVQHLRLLINPYVSST